MHIGDILVRKNLATREQIDAALERQKLSNAPLGKVLVNMDVLSEEALAQILNAPPEAPKTLAETGIAMGELRNLMLKTMNLLELQVPSEIADGMKVSAPMVRELLEDCVNQKLVEVKGSAGEGGMLSELRHSLTKDGKVRAADALEQLIHDGETLDRVVAVGCTHMMMRAAETTRPHGIKTIVSLNPATGEEIATVSALSIRRITNSSTDSGNHSSTR